MSLSFHPIRNALKIISIHFIQIVYLRCIVQLHNSNIPTKSQGKLSLFFLYISCYPCLIYFPCQISFPYITKIFIPRILPTHPICFIRIIMYMYFIFNVPHLRNRISIFFIYHLTFMPFMYYI